MRVSRTKPSKVVSAPRASLAGSSQDNTSGQRDNDPAVILDGTLKDAASADGATSEKSSTTPQPLVNRLI
jgi:hypothetical protein